MNLFEQAVEFAVKAHTGQIDEDGMPHIFHCFEVFRRVQEMFGGPFQDQAPSTGIYTVEEILIACLLHDTVEDSEATLDQIEELFGKNVRDIVDSVSRRVEPDGTKEFYREAIYRAKANVGGRLVKIADNLHNRSRLHKIKQAKWRDKLDFKYTTASYVLNDSTEPTWEQASGYAIRQLPDQAMHYYIADPNGKKIEVTEEEFKTLTKKK